MECPSRTATSASTPGRRSIAKCDRDYGLVVVGASWGGVAALSKLLGALPSHFGLPVAIVQHRRKHAEDTLRQVLQSRCKLQVKEPEDKEPIRPGTVYVAPAAYHLLVEDGHFSLSTEAKVWHSRPSIDVLFESAADIFCERLVGILLTGANPDGAEGLARIQQRGGLCLVQDPESAESRVMPDAALALLDPDHVLPLEELADLLARLDAQNLPSA
ncbi:MAG: chemotaxis protein CheB [Candidatus Wallbacteria bacterium]|nr:chemotaxis protein CheB [Candidatus Wallbacteria bacterium]